MCRMLQEFLAKPITLHSKKFRMQFIFPGLRDISNSKMSFTFRLLKETLEKPFKKKKFH